MAINRTRTSQLLVKKDQNRLRIQNKVAEHEIEELNNQVELLKSILEELSKPSDENKEIEDLKKELKYEKSRYTTLLFHYVSLNQTNSKFYKLHLLL